MRHDPGGLHSIHAENNPQRRTALAETRAVPSLRGRWWETQGSPLSGASWSSVILPGSGPARRAAAIRASVYSAAKQCGAPIKTFDRNSQISCCTRSVFQTTAGGCKVEQNAGASSNGSVGLHHILPLTLRGNSEALKSMAGSFRISFYNRFIPIYQKCFPTGIF